MGKSIKLQGFVCMALCSVLAVSFAFAGPDRGGRGGFDREAMQQRMMEMMKERMGTADDEWAVIQPRLQEVMTLQGNAMGGRMRGMFGRGRRGRDQQEAEAPTEEVEIAANALQETLDKEEPTAAEIKAKLAALRGAREKNKQKLVTAQQKLKEVLTVKQEAMLVMMGMLE